MDWIATIKKTHEICSKYNLYTKKKFGQNFIIEPKVVDKIARTSLLNEIENVIEIGPGIGALTQMLSRYYKKVYSFEIDTTLKTYWKENNLDNVEIIFDDFLKVDLNNFLYQHPQKKFVVAANLPYYITTPILFKLFEYDFEKITVMMQKEVAQRFSATINTKHYNALSVIAQYRYDIKIEFNVSKTIFMPAPNVDSSIITFKLKKDRKLLNEVKFNHFVHECFTQRRKTLYNNLRNYPASIVELAFEKCSINLNCRAQELDLDKIIHLFEVMCEYDVI